MDRFIPLSLFVCKFKIIASTSISGCFFSKVRDLTCQDPLFENQWHKDPECSENIEFSRNKGY